eukprot:gene9590-2548_t
MANLILLAVTVDATVVLESEVSAKFLHLFDWDRALSPWACA